MKNRSINFKKGAVEIRGILALILILMCSISLSAQSITISETINSDEPNSTYIGGTRVLYGCAWQYTFHVQVNSTASCSTATLDYILPNGLIFDAPIVSTGISFINQTGNTFHFQLSATSSYFEVKLKNTCSIGQVPGTSYLSSFTANPGTCTINWSNEAFQIFTPEILFQNLSYSDGTTVGPVQLLYKRNDATTFNRNFEVKIAEGQLRYIEMDYNPEYEIAPTLLKFTGNSGFVQFTYSGQTTFQFSTAEIFNMFNRNYLTKNDIISVQETFYIDECTDGLIEDTQYDLKTFCTDNGIGNPYLCKDNTQTYAIQVKNSLSSITIGLAISPALDICGTTPSDISFSFNNPNFSTDNTANTGIKKINFLEFPLDLDAFDFDPNDLTDLNSAVLRFNGVDVTAATINSLIGGNFLTFDNSINKKCTLNFNGFTNAALSTLWGGTSPFTNWYSALEYNDMKENTTFNFIFKNMSFDYFNAKVRPQNVLLSECRSPGNYLLFGLYNGYNTNFNYYRMCEMESQTTSSNSQWPQEYLDYNNTYNVTGFAEASSPDLISGGAPISMEFYFSTSSGSPWNYIYPIMGGSPSFFNCPNLTYQVEIILPDNMQINTSNIEYYTNPNDPLSLSSIPTPVGILPGDGTRRYVIDLVDASMVPVTNPNGKINAQISLIPCNSSLSAFANVNFKLRSFCNSSCPDRYNTLACFGTEVHWRCNGPCCGPPQGTSNFSFNRITPGFIDATMTSNVTLGPNQKVNRSYACDIIHVESHGSIEQEGSFCTDETGTYTVQHVEEFYFQIKYISPINFQFFDFVDAQFTTSLTGTINIPNYTVTPLGGNEFKITFLIANGALATTLQNSGGSLGLDFTANLKVSNAIPEPNYNPGFFIIPQIRGQFVSIINYVPLYEELSCDDHGDNMTVVNVKSYSSGAIHEDGWADDGYNWSIGTNGICKRRFELGAYVLGGMNGLDEFPNEFRPILLWPDQLSSDQISFTVPNKFYYIIPSDYSNSIFFQAKDRISWSPANYSLTGQTLTITGFDYMGNLNHPWPVFEHDGNKIGFTIKGELINDCPPEQAYTSTASYHLPLIKRAYSPDPGCQENVLDTSILSIPVSDYTLVMNSANTTFYLNNQVGTIVGLKVKYHNNLAPLGVSATYLNNFWIRNLSSADVNIISINIGAPSNTTATLNSGYYQLGTLNNNTEYDITINYQLLNCTVSTNIPLNLEYGFSCLNYPTIAPPPSSPVDFACKTNIDSISLFPYPSSLSINGQLITSPIVSPCSPFQYQVNFDGLLQGDVQNIHLFVQNIPSDFIFSGATFILNSGAELPLSAPTIGVNSLEWNITSDVLLGNGFSQADDLIVFVDFVGNCSLWGTQQSISFSASASDICNDALSPVNGSPFTSQITFPSYNSSNNNCENCLSCDSLRLSFKQKEDCLYSFEAEIPGNINCAFSLIEWDFGDGLSDIGPSVTHQFTDNGSHQVCYHYTCYDGKQNILLECQKCDTVKAECLKDTFCIKVLKVDDPDIGENIITTSDKGFAIAGTIFKDAPSIDPDMYFMKFKPNLSLQFYKRIGDFEDKEYEEKGYSVVSRPDGYFIAGNVKLSEGDEDIFIVKLDTHGDFIWGFRYGYNKSIENCRKMINMDTNGEDALLVVGFTNKVYESNYDILALKINPLNGSILKQNTYCYNATSNEFGFDVVKTGWHTITDHYAIVGEHYNDLGKEDIIVINIKTNLGLINGKIISADDYTEVANGMTAYNGSLFLTGRSTKTGKSDDLLMMQLNGASLSVADNNNFYSVLPVMNEQGYKVKVDSDNKLVVVGKTDANIITSGPDGLILRIDPDDKLKPIWPNAKSTVIQPGTEQFKDVINYGSSYYLVTGNYFGSSFNDQDIFIAKINKKGESCCLFDYPMSYKGISYKTSDVKNEKDPEFIFKPHGQIKDYKDIELICNYGGKESRLSSRPDFNDVMNDNISIIPNPNAGSFKISLNNANEVIKKIKVLDLSGKIISLTILAENNAINSYEVSLKDVAVGIYFVEIESETGQFTSKISIQK